MGFCCWSNMVSKSSTTSSLSACLKSHKLKSFDMLKVSKGKHQSTAHMKMEGGFKRKWLLCPKCGCSEELTNRDAARLLQSSLQGDPHLWEGAIQMLLCKAGSRTQWKIWVPQPNLEAMARRWLFCQAKCVQLSSSDHEPSAANSPSVRQTL